MNDYIEDIKTLVVLGLTGTQAKCYFALLDIGPASIRDVSKASNVARPDTYRAILELQELGFVEKIIGVPNKYKPLPIRDTSDILMSMRKKENNKLAKNLNNIIENYKVKEEEKELTNEGGNFVIISGTEATKRKIVKHLEDACKKVCTMTSMRKMLNFSTDNFETIKKVLCRNVTIEIITEESMPFLESRELTSLKTSPFFQHRCIPELPPAQFVVFDEKEVFLSELNNLKIDFPVVFSNYPSLILLSQNYFETTWSMAKEKSSPKGPKLFS